MSIEEGIDKLSNRCILDPGSNTYVINTEDWTGRKREYREVRTRRHGYRRPVDVLTTPSTTEYRRTCALRVLVGGEEKEQYNDRQLTPGPSTPKGRDGRNQNDAPSSDLEQHSLDEQLAREQ